MKRLLITGGSGFIGSNFIHQLLADPARDCLAVNADCLTYAADPANVAACAADPRYRFYQADIRDRSAMAALFARYDFDTVFNFAAESHVDRSLSAAADFVSTNIGGLQSLLEAARNQWQGDYGGRRFIQISTDEVYGPGQPGESRFREDAPYGPGNPYAASKAGGELLALAYWRSFGLPVLISRCCNNYGPRQHREKLIPKLITLALAGEALPLYGQGLQRREWLYVADHCQALLTLARLGAPGQAYNIGSGDERPNLETARLILRALDLPEDRLSFVPDRPGHDFRYGLDCSRLQALGWQAQTGFDRGLAATVAFYTQ